MNRRRRWLLLVAAGLFVASVLVPPWAALIDEGGSVYFDGWHPLFSRAMRGGLNVMEYRTLLVEWAALAVVTAALWAILGTDRKGPTP